MNISAGSNLPLRVELEAAERCLRNALALTLSLSGQQTRVDDPRKSNSHLAKLSADLRFAVHLCNTAAAEMDSMYWRIKGRNDPREK